MKGDGGTVAFDSAIAVPVTIKRIEVGSDPWGVVVHGSNGETGTCVGTPRLPDVFSLFARRVVPFFVGRDAREIESLVDVVYRWRTNYKYDSMPFWCGVAHVELAVLDLLGRSSGKSVGDLFGGRRRDRISVYLSSLRRDTTPEEEVATVAQRLEATGARACKVKIGGRMSENADAAPGRTEGLVRLIRERLAPGTKVFADANSSYTPERAIEIGRMLEDYRVDLFEEPVPWLDFVGTKRVADALEIPVAACEQDYDLWKIGWFAREHGVDVIQPDVFYVGGLIRAMRAAALAAEHGIPVMPHSPHTDATAAPMLHLVSLIPNADEFHEFRIDHPTPAGGYGPGLAVTDGEVEVPSGPGLGIDVDIAWLGTRELALEATV
ncbi:MAG: mandelate racemase/muconate lactonizing enzyme family protein [Spirochaetota bacterium]